MSDCISYQGGLYADAAFPESNPAKVTQKSGTGTLHRLVLRLMTVAGESCAAPAVGFPAAGQELWCLASVPVTGG